MESSSHRGYARRTVLAGIGGVVLSSLATQPVAGQETPVAARAVIPEPEQFAVDDIAGFFLHVDPDTSPSRAQVADACGYADWPSEGTRAYDVWLVDRTGEEYASEPLTLYVPDRRSVPAGGLYVINRVQQCDGSYVGIEIEQLNAGDGPFLEGSFTTTTDPETVADTEAGDDQEIAADPGTTEQGAGGTTTGSGPGFGILATLAGLAGGGWLARRRD